MHDTKVIIFCSVSNLKLEMEASCSSSGWSQMFSGFHQLQTHTHTLDCKMGEENVQHAELYRFSNELSLPTFRTRRSFIKTNKIAVLSIIRTLLLPVIYCVRIYIMSCAKSCSATDATTVRI